MRLLENGLIDIHHLTTNQIEKILELSSKLKNALINKDISSYKLAEGKDLLVALLFYENSTRTRSSFEIAALRLGLKLTGFGSIEGSSVKKGESLAHTLDMFKEYMCDAIILRHPLDGAAKHAYERINIPVFNAGDGKRQHPTQTILDLFTIKERHNRLDNLHVGLGGDLKYGRTAHTLALALSLYENNTLHLCSPENLSLPPVIVTIIENRGCKVINHAKIDEMVEDIDIFYQTRIQKERIPDIMEFEKAKLAGIFTKELMDKTKENFGLMHPLPIDKSLPGIVSELDSHPKSIYKKQAGNGVPTRMANLAIALNLVDMDLRNPAAKDKSDENQFIKELQVNDKPARKGVSIRPIRQQGVVIDHLAPYSERVLVRLLKIRERSEIYRSATVRSVRRPENIKGMLMIENRELSVDEMKLVATISPNARVNIIKNSKVIKKLELSLPNRIEGIEFLQCPNKGCISRKEHKENVSPIFIKVSKNKVACSYCDYVMDTSELVSNL